MEQTRAPLRHEPPQLLACALDMIEQLDLHGKLDELPFGRGTPVQKQDREHRRLASRLSINMPKAGRLQRRRSRESRARRHPESIQMPARIASGTGFREFAPLQRVEEVDQVGPSVVR
jgi:hypothetical protein